MIETFHKIDDHSAGRDCYEVRAVWNDGEGGKVSQPFSHEKMYEKEVGRKCDHYGVYRNNDDGTQTHVVDFDDRPKAQRKATRDMPGGRAGAVHGREGITGANAAVA